MFGFVCITCMIVHGHVGKKQIHLFFNLNPTNFNIIIGSIGDASNLIFKILFENLRTTPLFEVLLEGKENCFGLFLLCPYYHVVVFLLPNVTNVQLHNCWKDSKSWNVFIFGHFLLQKSFLKKCTCVSSFLVISMMTLMPHLDDGVWKCARKIVSQLQS